MKSWEEKFMMKRILTVVLVLCVLFSFFACAKKEKEPSWEESLEDAISDLSQAQDALEKIESEVQVPEQTEPAVTEKAPETTKNESTGLGTDFKAAMDSYESFMNEYVAFMKKYQANPTDFSLLSDYADYMAKYAEFVKAFEKCENDGYTFKDYYHKIGRRCD
jgi:hypothetical protein